MFIIKFFNFDNLVMKFIIINYYFFINLNIIYIFPYLLCEIFIFLIIFALFNEFNNIFFYIFEMAVSLNYFYYICYLFIPVFN